MIMWLYVHIVLIISGPYLIRVLAIACYECNQFPNESKSPCPATKTVNYGLMYDVSVFLMQYYYYWFVGWASTGAAGIWAFKLDHTS